MKIDKEYEMLREEIQNQGNKIHNMRNWLYTSFAAILAIAVSQNKLAFWFIPYVIIIPMYILSLEYEKNMYRAAAYIKVFLEDGNEGWETRLYQLNCHATRKFVFLDSTNTPFVFLVVIVTFSIVIKMKAELCKNQNLYIGIIIIINVLIIMIMFFKPSTQSLKEKYVSEWEKVKDNH